MSEVGVLSELATRCRKVGVLSELATFLSTRWELGEHPDDGLRARYATVMWRPYDVTMLSRGGE